MKYTIELNKEELDLINRALDIYSRIGLLQFNYLTDCYSLQKMVWDKDLQEGFEDKVTDLKSIFGYPRNSNPGIFSKNVGDDCRIAAHIHQQIRHFLYLEKGETRFGIDAYPADICQIAGMKNPDFQIKPNL